VIKRIVSFALYQPLFVVLALLLFVGGGIAAFKALPIEAFPDVTDTQVNVITLYPGRAAEEVEKQVTIPLEVALAGLPNQVRMFSHTNSACPSSCSPSTTAPTPISRASRWSSACAKWTCPTA
jgi:cobalt-zinc-cadmium resistance protein CzcA